MSPASSAEGWPPGPEDEESDPSAPPDSPGRAPRPPHPRGAAGAGAGAARGAGALAASAHTPRQHFQQQLRELERRALGGLDLVVEQLDRVLEALEHQDVELAARW